MTWGSKLPSDHSGSQIIYKSIRLDEKKTMVQIRRSISNSVAIMDQKLNENDAPGNGTFLFDLTWKVNSYLNRSIRTPLDS